MYEARKSNCNYKQLQLQNERHINVHAGSAVAKPCKPLQKAAIDKRHSLQNCQDNAGCTEHSAFLRKIK